MSDTQPNPQKKFFVTITEKKHQFLPKGVYLVMLIDIDEGVGKYQQPVFILHFEVVSGKYDGEIVRSILNKSSSGERGKIWSLIKALSGKELKPKDGVDLFDLKGKTCYINVEKGVSENGKTFDDVKEYIALREFEDIERLCPEP